ncbi:MAG: ATP synthase subunit I, partial [Desulfobacterales bacterium]|nr:ATP synthase subunit I [Desulfobacterales bacterium]
MLKVVQVQERILKFVTRANWVLFAGSTVAGVAFTATDFALGIFFGALLVTVNFHLLARTLHRALTPARLASHHLVLAKYYLRFLVSGFVIFLLIAGRVVHPVGLVIGLSVVVMSILL